MRFDLVLAGSSDPRGVIRRVGAFGRVLGRGVKNFTSDVGAQWTFGVRAFWVGYVQEGLKRLFLHWQVAERLSVVAESGCALLRIPWSESEEVSLLLSSFEEP